MALAGPGSGPPRARPRRRWPVRVGVGLACVLAVGGAWRLGGLRALELRLLDAMVAATAGDRAPPDLLLVTVDDGDLVGCGCSLGDGELATVLAAVLAHGPLKVGLDLFRDRPVPPGGEALAALIAAEPRLVVVRGLGAGVPAPPAAADPDRVAFADMILDPDGGVRRAALFLSDGAEDVPSLALALANARLEADGLALAYEEGPPYAALLGAARYAPLAPGFGPYLGADGGGYQVALTWPGGRAPTSRIAARDILEGRAALDAVRGRLVLVGSTARSTRDFFATALPGAAPGATVHGVELHARTTRQLLAQARGEAPVLRAPGGSPAEALGIALASALGAAAGFAVRHPLRLAAGALAAAAAWLGGAFAAFAHGLWLPAVGPLLALGLGAAAAAGETRWREGRDRADLRRLLGTFVSPEVAAALWEARDRLVAGGAIVPAQLPATVMFTDVAGFTSLTERLAPEVMVPWLDRYMAAMTDLVVAHGGVVNGFMGDGVMAVFGVPVPRADAAAVAADARAAVACALAMRDALDGLNRAWAAEGLPEARVRIGLDTGRLTAGTVGSGRRRQYTVLGDTANTAQRLESLALPEPPGCDPGHCRILVSAATEALLGLDVAREPLGPATLKGKEKAVMVYRIVGPARGAGSAEGGPGRA